jgi:hypothetical protein
VRSLKVVLFYLYISAAFYWAPISSHEQPEVAQTAIQSKETWINIFVHGIMSIKPHVSFNNILRFMSDDVENTTYSKTVEIMRQDDIFYKNQAMNGYGLKKIDPNHVGKGLASNGLASILNDTLAMSYGDNLDNHYYTFGWTGLLSPSRRYKDARDLYEAIEKEIARFKSKGINPKVRVIGYSHGGNVVLNLGGVRQREPVRKDLVIDETLLLGMPVQSETDYMVNDAVFKKIYHIYSNADRVQKLDFFSYERFFSSRIFKERPGFKLPKKLVQIQLKLTRNTPITRTCPKKMGLTYNFNNSLVVSGKSHLLRDSSPGHAELWFFGWTPVHYRDSFALKPLPAVSIFPFILKTVQDIEHLLHPTDPVIIDMRPEHGITLVKNVRNYSFYKVVDFIPAQTFKKLQEKALLYAPENFTDKAFNDHIYQAFLEADKLYKQNLSPSARKKNRKREKRLAKNKTVKKIEKTLNAIEPTIL